MSAAIMALPFLGLMHRRFASSMFALFTKRWRSRGNLFYYSVTQFLCWGRNSQEPFLIIVCMKVFDQPAIQDYVNARFLSKEEQKVLMDRVRSERIHSCAEGWLLVGCDVHRDTEKLKPWWPNVWPPSIYQIRNAGGVAAIKDRIRQGGLSVSEELKPWTGGFFHGLKISNALRPESQGYDGRWQIWEPAHQELVKDLIECNIVKKFQNYPRTPDTFRLSRCPATLLPPENELGSDIIAGLFAGSRLVLHDDKQWFAVPDSKTIRVLLEKWTIPWHGTDACLGKPRLLISPFYAALFAHLMPTHSTIRALNVKRPAMCPLLPQIYWDILFSKEHARITPWAESLPYSCSIRTYRRRQWSRRDLHREGVLKLGITGVSQLLKDLIHRWYQEACERRSASDNTSGHRIPGLAPNVPD